MVLTLMLSLVSGLIALSTRQIGKIGYPYAEESIKFHWLNSAINSMYYYTVKSRDPAHFNAMDFVYFFSGDSKSMSFISSSPIALKGIAMERLFLEKNTLFLAETPVFSGANDYEAPHETTETVHIPICTGVEELSLTFMGATSLTDRMEGMIPESLRLSLAFKDGARKEWYFRVRSDFVSKKDATIGFYHQF